jgi:hypothetical protein
MIDRGPQSAPFFSQSKAIDMKTLKRSYVLSLALLGAVSCSYYQNPPPPVPPTSDETIALEATKVTTPPTTISASYWKTADYILINPEEITKGKTTEEDGLLNMNGMYDGLADFNDGDASELRIKAAYDDDNLYLLATWKDQSFDVSQGSGLYNGPEDEHQSSNDPAGWTRQYNDDKLILGFNAAEGKDIWKWSLALSEPIGYAIDMIDDGSGEQADDGDFAFNLNSEGANRANPLYEWSGEQQDINRPLADVTILDPAFYLLNTTDFLGDVEIGEQLYQKECAECHGPLGDGNGTEWQTFVPMTDPTLNRFDRNALDELIGSNDHSGSSHWTKLDPEEKEDLTARLRAFSGVPGYIIDDAETALPDIQAVSNVNLARIDYYTKSKKDYQVLLIRPLTTGNNQDVQFNVTEQQEYPFDAMLADDDDQNRVGALGRTLIFK